MDMNLQADSIPESTVKSMSDAEQYRLRRMFDLLDESNGHLDNINNSMISTITDDIATSKAALASVEEGMKASLENNIAIAGLHDEAVGKAAYKVVDAYLDQGIQSLLRAGQSPVMTDAERVYYDILSPADAYNNSVLMNPVSLTDNTEVIDRTGGRLVDKVDGDLGNIEIPPIDIPPVPPVFVSINNNTTVPPTVIPQDGFVTYYTYLEGSDGVIHSIPINFPVGTIPPEEYHVNPYVPETNTNTFAGCVSGLPTANNGGNTNYFPYVIYNGTKYTAVNYSDATSHVSGGIIYDTVINGESCKLVLFAWPYHDTVPPTVPPVTGTGTVDDNCSLPSYQFNNEAELWWKQSGVNGCQVWTREYFPTGQDQALRYEGWTREGPPITPEVLINGLFASLACDKIDFHNAIVCGEGQSKSPPIVVPPTVPPDVSCPPGCVKIADVKSGEKITKACGHWDDPTRVCAVITDGIPAAINDILNAANTGNSSAIATSSISGISLSTLGGVFTAIPTIMNNLFAVSSGNVILDALKTLVSTGLEAATSFVSANNFSCGEVPAASVNAVATLGVAGWLERISSAPLTYLVQSERYELQQKNPQFIPMQSDFDNIFLSNLINKEVWECYTMANGNLPKTHSLALETKRSRIDPRQAVFLKRFEKLSVDDYKITMRSLGFLHDNERDQFEDSLVNLPGVSDLTRFLVRDVEDEEVVKKFKLFDKEDFNKKYKGDIKKWAEAQGIPYDVFVKYWTAHWQYLSNTEIFQALRRLRPGRNKDGLTFTKEDAEYLLKVNDFAPGQIDTLLALSYEVPTRTDVKRGYNIDALERKEVIEYLQDEGYTKDDAEVIAKIFDVEKDLYKLQINMRYSAFTIKQLSNMYAQGELSKDEVIDTMRTLGLKQEQIDKAIKTAEKKSTAIANRKCIASIKKRYMNGSLDYPQAKQELENVGIATSNMEVLTKGWFCEFASRSKDVPASKNVDWFVRGIISEGELLTRLTNLGYKSDATENWIAEAFDRRQKQFEAKARQMAAEEEKRRKEEDKKRKDKQKEILDQQKKNNF